MSETHWFEPDGLRFRCTGCGNCCKGPDTGYVFLSEPEIVRLAERLGLSLDQFGRTYLRKVAKGRISLREKANFDCVFWEDGAGCVVYEDRPIQCRTFPFWPEVIETRAAWDEEAASCPGMNAGKRYTPKRILELASGEGQTPDGPNRGER